MTQVADGIWRLSQSVGPLINAYLSEDVLIDAGRRQDAGRILGHLQGRPLSLVALTHVHPDHQGSVAAICQARGVGVACHAADVEAMEGRGRVSASDALVPKLIDRAWSGPPHDVERILHDGDEVGGLRVVHAPGHSPGEVILFRERDRVAICGDVVRNLSYATGRPRVGEPPDAFNADSAENRRSIAKLAGLRPSLILPGHGPPIRDPAAFARFADRVAARA